jgi:hypothetical protein
VNLENPESKDAGLIQNKRLNSASIMHPLSLAVQV